MTARGYFVDGVQLVNTGGELCEACGERKAVGRSIKGHAICPRCAGLHAHFAEELAQEVEASRQRRQRATDAAVRSRLRRAVGDAEIQEYRRQWYKKNRERKLAQSNARNHRLQAERTHFMCGHEMSTANTYRDPRGRRHCRTCRNNQSRKAKSQARRREQQRLGFGRDGRRHA